MIRLANSTLRLLDKREDVRMIGAIGFSYKRQDGYFRLFIDNVEYEGNLNSTDPEKDFEYFVSKFASCDKINALKELEAVNGGTLKRINVIEKSENEKILKGQERLDWW